MENRFVADQYKSAIVYQIYTKSFFDSDGDGIGDIKGVTSKLPYLSSLGVDVIALSSILETESDASVFGTTDFCRVNPAVGTIADLEELLAEAHKLSLSVFLSFPLSFTSSSHPWFEKSIKSTSLNPYREYYIWKPGKGKNPPDQLKTPWKSSVWTFDVKSGEWYRAFYGADYPELNFDNPRLRKDVLSALRFWREKSVDGFFIENAHFTAEKTIRETPSSYKGSDEVLGEGKAFYKFLRDIKERAEDDFPIVLIPDYVDSKMYPFLAQDEKNGVDSVMMTDLTSTNRQYSESAFSAKDFIKKYLSAETFAAGRKMTVAFEDKDHSRLISSFAQTVDKTYPFVAKFLASLLLTAPSVPAIYQGQEIGMTNFYGKNGENNASLSDPRLLHARSPFQWDNNPNAAFTLSPYAALPVNENYHKINLLSEMQEKDSVFQFYRKLIAFRKSSSALSFGSFQNLSEGSIVCFLRESDTERLLIVANSTHKPINAKLPSELREENAICEICNYEIFSKTLNKTLGLRPYEVRIFRLKAPLLRLN